MHWEDLSSLTKYDMDELNDAFYDIFTENLFKQDNPSLYYGLDAMYWDLVEFIWKTDSGNTIKIRFDGILEKTCIIINNKRGWVDPNNIMPLLERYITKKDIDSFITRIASRVGYVGNLLNNYALDRVCLFRDSDIDNVAEDLILTSEYWNMGADYYYDHDQYEDTLDAIKHNAFTIWDESDPDTTYSPKIDGLENVFTTAIEKGYKKCVNNFVNSNEDYVDANILTQIWFFGDVIYG